MRLHAVERMLDEQEERDRRYGLAHDEDEELEREFEMADRIAEHASMPAGDPGCRALARKRLGLPGSPYEHPHEPEPRRFAEGERVRHHESDGTRAGRIVRTLDHEGLVEVDFGRDGTTLIAVDAVEPEGS